MEFFGSRLIWTAIEQIIDPDVGDVLIDEEPNLNNEPLILTDEQPSTSGKNLPNEIEYAD